MITAFVILLTLAIWADTPADAPLQERFLAWLLLRIMITVIAGGFLYGLWCKCR